MVKSRSAQNKGAIIPRFPEDRIFKLKNLLLY